MAETMKQTDAYSIFKKAVEALGDDKVALISEAVRDMLDDDQLDELIESINEARGDYETAEESRR